MYERIIRVALADDHPLVMFALRDCMQRMPEFQVTSRCGNGTELLAALDREPAGIAITDFCMGRGDVSSDGFKPA
ncbi:response regulator transcription factor [Cupriavidus consociatus]|uniref:response regulator transcription factor n=1 Tax=Cupriavidus consociatus TaxID=2821357 RepID=UPI001AE22491|nr:MULTISPECIES: response regulator transcription factor [unclassified Cupriavidus]MBP0619279.1 response regulator transcription factor [Cupriavidus sp. LEh25]MDK2655926.1 response regulator transcription factor [Cupriavidus sp. LEh21]